MWKERASEASANAERSQRALAESDAALAAMRDEVQAVQARLVERERRVKELEQENGVLIERSGNRGCCPVGFTAAHRFFRWLTYKNDEINRLNEVNRLSEQQQHEKLLKAKQAEALLDKGREIMAPENRTAPTLLDRGDAAPGLYGVAARLPSAARRETVAHQGEANCVAFNPSGSKFCTGGADNRVKVWDARSLTVTTQLAGSTGSIMGVYFSSNDSYVVGSGCDNIARVWDLGLGRLKHTLTGAVVGIRCCASCWRFFSCSLVGHIGKVYAGVFSADTSKVVTGAHDRTVKVWDMVTGNPIKTIFCFSSCNDVCMADAYQVIYSVHLDGVLRLWDARTGDAVREFKDVHSKQITSAAVLENADTPLLLTSARDNVLKIWDLRQNAVTVTLKDEAYRSGLNWSRACWSPDGQYVAAGGAEGSLFIWNAQDAKLVKQLGSESSACISSVAWSPTGHQVIATDRKSKLIVFE